MIKQFGVGQKPKYDAFFVGLDKGRTKELSKLKSIFDCKDISYRFHVVGDKGKKIKGLDQNYDSPLSYEEVINNDLDSRVIIDIVSNGQNGLTLRPLEALNLKRKLLTNMETIVRHRLYNSNNIFIIGKDDDSRLKEFVMTPFDENNYEQLVDYYSFKQWLNRFISYENNHNQILWVYSSYAWLFFDQTNCLIIKDLAKKREEKDGEREKRKEYTIMEQ